MSLINLIKLDVHGDERGSLISLEQNKNIPFEIKRTYYIFDTQPGVSRGFHAHRDLKQVAICLKGSCRFTLDNGQTRQDVILNSPDCGLVIDGVIWREMHDFSEDCVLLVFASEFYDKDDYIIDYAEFLSIANDNKYQQTFV